MSTVQCPICALRYHYQSELEQHAREDHGLPPEIHRPEPVPHEEHEGGQRHEGERVTSRILRFP